jgi:N-methylhydantoinase A/oxoprolinase/acetone carboxylase beta subunit
MMQVNEFMRGNHVPEMSVEEIAMGFIRVANEAMCRPIRNLTQGKGYGEKIFKLLPLLTTFHHVIMQIYVDHILDFASDDVIYKFLCLFLSF